MDRPDESPWRSLPAPFDQLIYGGIVSFSFNEDTAVGIVADAPAYTKPVGSILSGSAEENPLHPADHADCACFHQKM